ncbi:MAG: hypothetical protein EF806_02755 [Candidatus Methanoliparum thermophilum]|uniref:Uncharacterized protein n=1 Tax=Methanoliparum thermophilum TaxID=2491083 RepID=A0A520KTA7_METT2|nr:hypothetical protein [Candidatus Methanoliparum sp. LAM-1]RZN64980.1 MAG: hypothetical protein EF806_02755 [Candidatus Methanoliparum thermophilum]BDC36136.1 hypothetical protein MTLP_08180 [Candidatus Methanoliparum sp. LAM-1]
MVKYSISLKQALKFLGYSIVPIVIGIAFLVFGLVPIIINFFLAQGDILSILSAPGFGWKILWTVIGVAILILGIVAALFKLLPEVIKKEE